MFGCLFGRRVRPEVQTVGLLEKACKKPQYEARRRACFSAQRRCDLPPTRKHWQRANTKGR
jgi:hypothetical protein